MPIQSDGFTKDPGGSGGGSFTPPTGSGFVKVTGGVLDTASSSLSATETSISLLATSVSGSGTYTATLPGSPTPADGLLATIIFGTTNSAASPTINGKKLFSGNSALPAGWIVPALPGIWIYNTASDGGSGAWHHCGAGQATVEAYALKTSDQSVTGSATTKVTFGTKTLSGITESADEFTVPSDGFYEIFFNAAAYGMTAGSNSLGIGISNYTSGSDIRLDNRSIQGFTGGTSAWLACFWRGNLDASTKIRYTATPGSNCNITPAASASFDRNTWMSIRRLGPKK